MSAPKTPDRLRNRSRLRKLECFACPIDGRPIVYASRANVAKNGAPRCGTCGEPFMFSDVLDCADVQPTLVSFHPVHVDAGLRELRAATDSAREHGRVCEGCGAPTRSDYCAKCGRLTTTRADGTVDVQRIRTGTGEHEQATWDRCGAPKPLDRITYPRNHTVRAKAAARPDASQEARSEPMPF